MSDFPYERICAQLQQSLDAVLSSRRSVHDIAVNMYALNPSQIAFHLKWTDIVSHTNCELAYQFAKLAPYAITLMDTEGCQAWVLQAMDVYDREGLYPGSKRLNDLHTFAAEYRLSHISVSLAQVQPILHTLLQGLSGRQMTIASATRAYTDSEVIYLPAALNRFSTKEENYRLYKLTTMHLWAQNVYGTFKRANIESPHLHERLLEIDDNDKVIKLFETLETVRLNACIERDLPGIAREMQLLNPKMPMHDATWKHCIHELSHPDATVETTLQLTKALWKNAIKLPMLDFIYAGELDTKQVAERTHQRLQNQQQRLAELNKDKQSAASASESDDAQQSAQTPSTDNSGQPDWQQELQDILSDAGQDIDNIPEQWLQHNPQQDNNDDTHKRDAMDAQSLTPNSPQDETLYFYPEWDYKRQQYRQNWCTLREKSGEPIDDTFVADTLNKYRYLIKTIRQKFELLRDAPKRLKAQKNGDEIDVNALIDALVDYTLGGEMDDRVYIENQHQQRNVAVIFMLDMSGSTKGWINQAMRESLLLLVEALQALGDQYAIYGFSGMTRNRCDVYRIKEFNQPFNDAVRANISGIRAKDYTRMGPAIRHLTTKFSEVSAKTNILITLSDGKPDDYDGYHGEYGIADTQRALLESKLANIHSFCITLDTHAADYLPRMYKNSNYIVIDDVKKLPLKVTEIYRKIAA